MGSCAFGTCTDPNCPMCVDLPRRFPPLVRCPKVIEDGKMRVQCRFITGHAGYCRAPTSGKRVRGKRAALWDAEATPDDLPGDG